MTSNFFPAPASAASLAPPTPWLRRGALVLGLSLLAGCVTAPQGPSVLVLPGSGRSFDAFRSDDLECQRYAQYQTGPNPNEAGVNAGVQSAAVGTAIGAVAGAALGGRSGAATGAGAGLLLGSAAGAGAAEQTARGTQRHYDNAYVQCMYAKGHRVPVPASQYHAAQPYNGQSYAPPAASIPPPPPGNPPPPPSGVVR